MIAVPGVVVTSESELNEAGVQAAADQLYKAGLRHRWWPPSLAASWRDLDAIGRNEFVGIVQEIIESYLLHASESQWKNIQIIDGADNASNSLFQVTRDEFRLIFPRREQDLEISEAVFRRLGRRRAIELFSAIWERPILKSNAAGIHGTVFYNYYKKRHYLPASKREVDRDESQINPAQRKLY